MLEKKNQPASQPTRLPLLPAYLSTYLPTNSKCIASLPPVLKSRHPVTAFDGAIACRTLSCGTLLWNSLPWDNCAWDTLPLGTLPLRPLTIYILMATVG